MVLPQVVIILGIQYPKQVLVCIRVPHYHFLTLLSVINNSVLIQWMEHSSTSKAQITQYSLPISFTTMNYSICTTINYNHSGSTAFNLREGCVYKISESFYSYYTWTAWGRFIIAIGF